MTDETYQFRGAVLGGFNRQDVAAYIEQTAQEQRRQLAQLSAQLEQEREEKSRLSARLEELQARSGELEGQQAKVRASLEESTHSLTRLRGELRRAHEQLESAQRELTLLREQVDRLEPLAQRYEALKDHVATVELDAHRQAQATLSQAQAQAETVRRDAAQWLTEVTGSYEELRRQVDACARRAEETSRVFCEKGEAYHQLLRQGGLEEGEDGRPAAGGAEEGPLPPDGPAPGQDPSVSPLDQAPETVPEQEPEASPYAPPEPDAQAVPELFPEAAPAPALEALPAQETAPDLAQTSAPPPRIGKNVGPALPLLLGGLGAERTGPAPGEADA